MADRYPLEPLLRLTGWTHMRVQQIAPCNGAEYRLRREKGVTERIADRLAVAAGLHPWVVWPEMQTATLVPCAECGELFAPSHAGHRYCHPRCRDRRYKRDRYATDQSYRTDRAVYMREYRRTSRRTIRAQSAAWGAANIERRREINREATRRWRERKKAA